MAVNITGLEGSDQKAEEVSRGIGQKMDIWFMNLFPVPLKEKLFFLQHLSVMLRAGIGLSSALKTLSRQSENKKFKVILEDVSSNVEKGISFTESLRLHEKDFGELFINMVEAGEISGKLEEVLGRLHLQTKKSYELRSKVKGAMTYPIVILCAVFGIGAFMLVYIIPKITSMFKEMGAKLPLPTQILITVSDFVVGNIVVVSFSLAFTAFIIFRVLKTRTGKYYFQAMLLKTPIFSTIIKKINIAQFSRTISSLLKTDIMIIKAFQVTANTLGNLHYRDAVLEMAEKIKRGGKINEVVANYPKLFSPIIVQMIAVGEETGELDNIIEELAGFYEAEIDQVMSNLPSIIEPILILMLGLGVGGIAVSILLPMFTIGDAI